MRIMGLAATAAVMAAASGSAAMACEGPGPCAYAPASSAYAFQPPAPMHHGAPPKMHGAPKMQGAGKSAWLASPGPTPAYAADEVYEEEGGDDYDRYGGEHRGHGGKMSYGEVRKAHGSVGPYTPAFGRTVTAERAYAGPGYGYQSERQACGTCAPPPRYVSPCADDCRPRATVSYKETQYEEAKPVYVTPDFFYGGITGGAGYGLDGGGWGGGGGVFVDSGYGFSGTQGFSRGMSGASASARASAFAFSYGGGKMKHGGGGGCFSCGVKGGHMGGKGGGKH